MGKGTTFHIYLPVSKEPSGQERPKADKTHRGTGTILVLDDDNFLREILGEMLGSMGYTVLEARTGDEVLRICDSRPDLRAAILDLTIRGGMGGQETLSRLKPWYPVLPVFAVSGYYENPVMAEPSE